MPTLCWNLVCQMGNKSPCMYPNTSKKSSTNVLNMTNFLLEGWIIHENIFAPRVLHYHKDQLIWKCRFCFKDEEDMLPLHTTLSDFRPPSQTDILLQNLNGNFSESEILHEWFHEVISELYDSRTLTFPHDRLPAIVGLAAMTG